MSNGRFERLDQVIDALDGERAELRLECDVTEWADLIDLLWQPMNYGTNRRAIAKATSKRGKPCGPRSSTYFVANVWRTDAGIYELACNS